MSAPGPGSTSGGPRQAVVVMGVSGSGKTTVARELAEHLGWVFAEADEFHPPASVAKMASGVPLDDEDRWPWLADLRDWMDDRAADGQDVVLTCSALKRSYRDVLRGAAPRVRFLHLTADPAVLAQRMGSRSGHYMPASLLASQLAALQPLEADEDGVAVDVDAPVADVVRSSAAALDLR